MRYRSKRRSPAGGPAATRDGLARQITDLADALTDVVEQATTRRILAPRPVTYCVHELRGWAARIDQGTAPPPAAVDATRLLAYLRGLPDQQFLAVIADLPWARLDTLLDAANTPDVLRPGSLRP